MPTEAEWEYAARSTTTTPFSFGPALNIIQANYYGNNPRKIGPKGTLADNTTPVKSFSPNDWGLYDMHGNVWEWCRDWYGDYPTSSVTDPKGPSSGRSRVLRGGSWFNGAGYCRSANRNKNTPSNRNFNCGFRLVALLLDKP